MPIFRERRGHYAENVPIYRAREVQRYKQKNELDESGNISSYAYEMRVDFIPLPCTGEELSLIHI